MSLALKTYYDEALSMVSQLGIPVGKITDVYINSRLKSTWGRCVKNPNRKSFYIEVSRILIEEGSKEGIISTMIHEILHTCPMCFNHGKMWKEYAQMIYAKYGIDVKRTNTCEEKGIATPQPLYRYTLKCMTCGKEFKYKVKCSTVKNYTHFCCDKCRGKLALCETKEA